MGHGQLLNLDVIPLGRATFLNSVSSVLGSRLKEYAAIPLRLIRGVVTTTTRLMPLAIARACSRPPGVTTATLLHGVRAIGVM